MRLKNILKTLLIFILLGIIITISYFYILKKRENMHRKASVEDLKPSSSMHIAYDEMDFDIGENQKDIIKKLGKPNSVKVQEVKNSHDPTQTDEIHELFYNGLYIRTYKVTNSNEEFLSDISVTSTEYRMQCGLGVGSSKLEVESILGEPTQKSKDSYTYDALGTINIYFDGDRVSKIEKLFYID